MSNSSLEAIWERTCKVKIHYESKQAAAHQLRQMSKKRAVSTLEVYACRHCGGWVLGNKKPKGQREKKVVRPLAISD